MNDTTPMSGYTKAPVSTDVVVVPSFATDPTAVSGRIYFNTADNKFYGYNGSAWVRLDYNP